MGPKDVVVRQASGTFDEIKNAVLIEGQLTRLLINDNARSKTNRTLTGENGGRITLAGRGFSPGHILKVTLIADAETEIVSSEADEVATPAADEATAAADEAATA